MFKAHIAASVFDFNIKQYCLMLDYVMHWWFIIKMLRDLKVQMKNPQKLTKPNQGE